MKCVISFLGIKITVKLKIIDKIQNYNNRSTLKPFSPLIAYPIGVAQTTAFDLLRRHVLFKIYVQREITAEVLINKLL